MEVWAVKAGHEAELGAPDPRKGDILRFMRSRKPFAYAEGFVTDCVTRKSASRCIECVYEAGDLRWCESDVYNLERHDLRLNPEFRRRALAIIDGENPSTDAAR
ncbi:hypothetical protein I3I95_10565 [bacterium]|nr:hypothetical protein [bacterium]